MKRRKAPGCGYCGHDTQRISEIEEAKPSDAYYITLICENCKGLDQFGFRNTDLAKAIRFGWFVVHYGATNWDDGTAEMYD